MFGTLFLKECKEILKSITYYIFLVCMILFFITQMGQFIGVTKPVEGKTSYGYQYSGDKTTIIECTLKELVQEYYRGEYSTYPIGFYKRVKLNEQKQKRVGEILQETTGLSEAEINELKAEPKANLTYEQFLAYMEEVDELLGGGSSYSPEVVKKNAKVPMTYEDALKEYEDIVYKDKVSGAYARMFSDYMGIVLGIFPVFLAVTRGLRDKRAKASEVIFSKKISSANIVLSRYAATIVMILIPLLLLSVTPTLQSLYSASSNGVQGDAFAFIKTIFGWLLPTILVTVSVGFFFTELTDSPLGILVQGIWWLVSIFSSIGNLIGNVGWNLIPRFNTVGAHGVFTEIFNQLVRNRLFYCLISMLLLIATIVTYQWKRKGVLNLFGKIRTNYKDKLEV